MLRLLKLDQKLADDEKKIVSTVKEIEAVQKTASWLVKAERARTKAYSPENAGGRLELLGRIDRVTTRHVGVAQQLPLAQWFFASTAASPPGYQGEI